jgi:hypothetical protein
MLCNPSAITAGPHFTIFSRTDSCLHIRFRALCTPLLFHSKLPVRHSFTLIIILSPSVGSIALNSIHSLFLVIISLSWPVAIHVFLLFFSAAEQIIDVYKDSGLLQFMLTMDGGTDDADPDNARTSSMYPATCCRVL